MFAKMHVAAGFKSRIVFQSGDIKVDLVGKSIRFIGYWCAAIAAEMAPHIGAAFKDGGYLAGPAPFAIGHTEIGGDGRGGVQPAGLAMAVSRPVGCSGASIRDFTTKAATIGRKNRAQ